MFHTLYSSISSFTSCFRDYLLNSERISREMLRNLVILVDFSDNVLADDYKPNRLEFIKRNLHDFIRLFFDENPLSRLALVTMRSRRAYVISPLTCLAIFLFFHVFFPVNSDQLLTLLMMQRNTSGSTEISTSSPKNAKFVGGLASLQHGLQEAARLLKFTKESDSKEIFGLIYVANCFISAL